MEDLLKRQGLPPGVSIDPDYFTWSVQGRLTSIDLSLLILALIAVIARVYIRLFHLHVFRLDDYFMVAAMVCSAIACGLFLHTISLGMGRHFFAIPPENVKPLLMWIFIVAILIPLSLCFVKLSIALFLLPLTRRTPFRRFLWGVIVFLVVFMLFTFFTLVFGCVPIAANWNFNMRPPPIGTGNARCFSLTTYRNIALLNSVINILTDVVLAIIPVPLIWTLQVNKRTKASLILILSLGFFACAAGIIKTPLLYHFFDDMDSTGSRSWYYAWQIIEMNVAIIAATLPSLKPAFRWLLETAKSLATGVSANRTGTSRAYKRYFSSGYLPRRDGSGFHNISAAASNSQHTSGGKGEDGIEVELKDFERYNVRVKGHEKIIEGGRRMSHESMNAILRLESLEGAETRAIVKTTKVTIVTSSGESV